MSVVVPPLVKVIPTAAVLITRPKNVTRLVRVCRVRTARGDHLKEPTGECKSTGERTTRSKAPIGILHRIDDENRKRPIGIELIPLGMVECADVGLETGGVVEPDPLKELRAPLQVALRSHIDRFKRDRHSIIDVGPIDNPFERVHGALGRQKLVPPLQSALDVPHDGFDIARRPILRANRSCAFQKDRGNRDAAEHELPGVLGSSSEG